jgi:MerR family mercuric resistance operon transcriptional regulator
MNSTDNLTIGQLAKVAGVHVETIRFYQRQGLLPEPKRAYGSIRRYGAAEVARLRFIKSAQRLGLSLAEIGELLRLEQGMGCTEAAEIGARHLAEVRLRLADLQRVEAALAGLVTACRAPQAHVSCPLIAALHDTDTAIPGKRRSVSADFSENIVSKPASQ